MPQVWSRPRRVNILGTKRPMIMIRHINGRLRGLIPDIGVLRIRSLQLLIWILVILIHHQCPQPPMSQLFLDSMIRVELQERENLIVKQVHRAIRDQLRKTIRRKNYDHNDHINKQHLIPLLWVMCLITLWWLWPYVPTVIWILWSYGGSIYGPMHSSNIYI